MDDHDHSQATHSMKCPVEGCDEVIKAHAHSDEEAVKALMEAGKAHFTKVHPDAKGMSAEEMEKATKDSMQKIERQDSN